ncbi:MAG: EAL domain-containing protein [Oceanospirillaceae bacterium]|nr:EAL domain-containing protein [Oceanospirillaceae bacterium]
MNELSSVNKFLSALVLLLLVIFSHQFLDLSAYDRANLVSKFERNDSPVSGDLVIIDIDDQSIKYFQQWPWPRSLYATLLQQLASANPELVVFDIDFSSTSFADQDQLFAQQLTKTHFKVALSTVLISQSPLDFTFIENIPIDLFLENTVLASANALIDPSGLVFHYPIYAANRRVSIGGMLAGISDNRDRVVLLDYSIDLSTIVRISFKNIVLGNFDPQLLLGKKILVGATAIELGDKFAVPKYGRLPGVLVHALGFETIIAEQLFYELSAGVILICAILMLLLSLLLFKNQKILSVLVINAALLTFIYLISSLLHYQFRIVLPVTLLYITVLMSFVWQLLVILRYRTMRLFKQINRNNYQSALIHQVIRDSSNAIVITDSEGRIKVANEKAKFMLDFTEETIESNHKVFDYLPHSETMIANLSGSTALDHNQTDFVEFLLVNGANQEFYIELLISKTYFEQSNALGANYHKQRMYDITITDLTEKRRIISQRKQSEIELIDLRNNDPLTKLANKNSLNRYLKGLIGAKNPLHCMLILINLDTLKEINQIYGLVSADSVICQVALELTNFLAGKGEIFRFSERIFAVVYTRAKVPTLQQKEACLQAIYRLFSKAINIQGQQLLMSVSLALSQNSQGDSSVETMVNNAVQTLDYVKQNKNIDFFIHERHFARKIRLKALLRTEISRAIEQHEFVLYYQSQHELTDGKLVAFEALIRWKDPIKGLRFPDEFIPAAEEFGLIDRIGEIVLEMSCRDASKLPEHISVSVNVSPSQFARSDIPALCERYLTQYGLNPQRLELEITESMMMHDIEYVCETLIAIKKMGINIAMDDFGTGYSSLQYLTKLPFDKLKIDRSFLTNITQIEQDKALLKSIISLGHSANKLVLAEGVEDLETLTILREIGCELGQGYYYSKPLPLADILYNLEDDRE